MTKKKKIIYNFILLLFCCVSLNAQPNVNQSLLNIKAGLDTLFFVKRFESIETPCLCIDSSNNMIAEPRRQLINSNYRIRLQKKHIIDSGVACLSRLYGRYAKFSVVQYDSIKESISGIVKFSYSYSASSIIQYLGLTYNNPDNSQAFFNKLIGSIGTFKLYPDEDKYRIQVVLTQQPYNKNDTVYGYLEIVKAINSNDYEYNIFFDQMNIQSGDNNNQIFVKFGSTTHNYESMYYQTKLYETLKNINSEDLQLRAEAIWTKSFFSDEACSQCKYIYIQSAGTVNRHHVYRSPNTDPVPAH